MLDYWITRKGIRRGNVPNPASNLYRIYLSFVDKLDLPDLRVATRQEFRDMFRKWGVREVMVGRYRCYLLAKYVVPKSVLDPTARRKPAKKKRPYKRRQRKKIT